MTTKQMMSMAASHAGISQAEIARRIGQTPANLNNKLHRDSITLEEWRDIAQAAGGQMVFQIVFPDGTALRWA